jgi:hypothetical protein
MGKEVDRDRIRQLVAEAIEGQGYELVEFVLRVAEKTGSCGFLSTSLPEFRIRIAS